MFPMVFFIHMKPIQCETETADRTNLSTKNKYIVAPQIGQHSVVVKRLHCNDKEVGSNPTTTRNEKQTLGDAPTEGSPMVQQDLNGKPEMLMLN